MVKYISKQIVKWHENHPRPMPWAGKTEPYLVWISEIILQQTRVNQGWDYYLQFIERFPTVQSLASAQEDSVLKQWEGLGYYSRARNLHKAAKIIVDQFQSQIPNTYEDIITLPGIGPYTASAILSFAFNKKYPVVDGNVIRVVARIFGIQEDTNTSTVLKSIHHYASQLIETQKPSIFNQAIMNFGALQCVPQNPNCDVCLLQKKCEAFRIQKVDQIPTKKKKIQKKKRYFHYFDLIDEKGDRIISKRDEDDIWAGLYEFIMREKKSSTFLSMKEINKILLEELSLKGDVILISKEKQKSILTHQIVIFCIYKLKCRGYKVKSKSLKVTNSVEEYAFPKLLDLYLCNK